MGRPADGLLLANTGETISASTPARRALRAAGRSWAAAVTRNRALSARMVPARPAEALRQMHAVGAQPGRQLGIGPDQQSKATGATDPGQGAALFDGVGRAESAENHTAAARQARRRRARRERADGIGEEQQWRALPRAPASP